MDIEAEIPSSPTHIVLVVYCCTTAYHRLKGWKWHPFIFYFVIYFAFLIPNPQYREVPRLGVESELQLLATATAKPDLSQVCSQHHTSWQQWILNQLSEARNRTCILMDASWIINPLSHTGTPDTHLLSHHCYGPGTRLWVLCFMFFHKTAVDVSVRAGMWSGGSTEEGVIHCGC